MRIKLERGMPLEGKVILTFVTNAQGHSQMAGVPEQEVSKILGQALTDILLLEELDTRTYRE